MSLGTLLGGMNVRGIHIFQQQLTPIQVPIASSLETSFVVPQLPIPPGQQVLACFVSKPSATSNVAVGGVRVVDSTHIAINFLNADQSVARTPPQETYTFVVFFG